MAFWNRAQSDNCFFQLFFFPELTRVSPLANESWFEIFTQPAKVDAKCRIVCGPWCFVWHAWPWSLSRWSKNWSAVLFCFCGRYWKNTDLDFTLWPLNPLDSTLETFLQTLGNACLSAAAVFFFKCNFPWGDWLLAKDEGNHHHQEFRSTSSRESLLSLLVGMNKKVRVLPWNWGPERCKTRCSVVALMLLVPSENFFFLGRRYRIAKGVSGGLFRPWGFSGDLPWLLIAAFSRPVFPWVPSG